MIKKAILIYLPFLFFTTCSTNKNHEGVDFFIQEIEGLSLDEAIYYIKDQSEKFKNLKELYGFDSFSYFDESDIKAYRDEEETFGELPKFHSAEQIKNMYDEFFESLYLYQSYQYPQTEIRIQRDYNNLNIPEKPEYLTKAIYFHDGSTDFTPYELNEWMDFPTSKVIDSMQVTAHYSYGTSFSSFQINKQLAVNGGTVKIDKIQDNMVRLILTGGARNFEEIVALNKDGKVLSRFGSNTETEGVGEIFDVYSKAFEKLAIKADKAKSLDDIKNLIVKTLKNLPPIINPDAKTIYTSFYKGNVASVIIYFAHQKMNEIKDLTIINKNACTAELIYTYDINLDKWGFLNQSGVYEIEPVYDNLLQINNLYYKEDESDIEGDDVYYFLDIPKKELVKLPGVGIAGVSSANTVAVENMGKLAIWGKQGIPVTDYIYDDVVNIEDCQSLIKVYSNYQYGLLDESGKTVVPVKFSFIHDVVDGLMLLEKTDKSFAFINTEGKTIIPLDTYTKVNHFSEGLAAVCKNNFWGFINKKGEIVIPLKYERVESFLHGVTLVKLNGKYGLIDKNDREIVPLIASGYSLSTNFGNRTYYLDGIEYDTYGNLVDDENNPW